jgi:hypothetical protein
MLNFENVSTYVPRIYSISEAVVENSEPRLHKQT